MSGTSSSRHERCVRCRRSPPQRCRPADTRPACEVRAANAARAGRAVFRPGPRVGDAGLAFRRKCGPATAVDAVVPVTTVATGDVRGRGDNGRTRKRLCGVVHTDDSRGASARRLPRLLAVQWRGRTGHPPCTRPGRMTIPWSSVVWKRSSSVAVLCRVTSGVNPDRMLDERVAPRGAGAKSGRGPTVRLLLREIGRIGPVVFCGPSCRGDGLRGARHPEPLG